MLWRGLLLVVLSSLAQAQESGCAAAAPALLQAVQRRDTAAHRDVMEASNISKSHSISNQTVAEKLEVEEDKVEEKFEDDQKKEKEMHEKVAEKRVESNTSTGPPTMPPYVSKASNISKSHSISNQTVAEKLEVEEDKVEEKFEDDQKREKEKEKGIDEKVAEKKSESNISTGPPTMPPYTDIDMNKDGVLTPKEFQTKRAKEVAEIEKEVKTVMKHETEIEDAKLSMERKIDEMPAYEDLDRNTDGVVTPAELKTSSDTAMVKELSYKALDGNADGAVTPGDFKIASEKWAAELTMQVEEKIKELANAREQRRKLEQDIDGMESYEDLDKQRDGVITRSEYGQKTKSINGTPKVASHAAATKVQKAGSTTTSLGFACLAVLVQAL